MKKSIDKFSDKIVKLNHNATQKITGGSGIATESCEGTTTDYGHGVTAPDTSKDGEWFADDC